EDRLVSFGAGEQFPLNDCGIAECTDEEHQQNRRTTAKILFEDQIIIIHRVAEGQILGKIADKYGVRVWDIKAWNRVSSKKLRVGQELLIYLMEE
ncbi:MAG TPA: LysM peptidoglycan-binding domain-containing protein, partial [Flavobacteriales bacterium]|nr:LysM peptidoglycan-binding domain-containing protein [Flavobacteriales bacterium]